MSSFADFSRRYDAHFKTTKTSRGLTYRYLSVPATNGVTLLWLHGFPSSIYDWHYQLDYFGSKGYGLIAPDMLGYGGTDKPQNPAEYTIGRMANDIADILDAEKLSGKIVAIGHDWGTGPLSRLADLHADRFAAFAWFNVGYMAPNPNAPSLEADLLPLMKQYVGAYWELFNKPEAAKICADNVRPPRSLWRCSLKRSLSSTPSLTCSMLQTHSTSGPRRCCRTVKRRSSSQAGSAYRALHISATRSVCHLLHIGRRLRASEGLRRHA